MQTHIVSFLVALITSISCFAEMKADCSNENTFLKLNELKLTDKGERVAELIVNFKDLNRILNLPEVILKQKSDGVQVTQINGNSAVLLNFTEAYPGPTYLPKREVSISVKLEGKKIRENIKLKCEK